MRIEKISSGNFCRFGRIIEYPLAKTQRNKKDLFRKVIVERRKVGWRIAYLIVRNRAIRRLESHPESFESFEPISGKALLYLAGAKKDLGSLACFLLDRPVILNKGVWHGVVSLNGSTEIKITENARVRSKYWVLGFRLNSKNHAGKSGRCCMKRK